MTSKPSRGLSEAQIREAIDELVGANQEPTTTKIRNLMGTGSFTTIGAVLTKWRAEQNAAVESQTPAMPEPLHRHFSQVWQAACKLAAELHDSERTGFAAERSSWQTERQELEAEISRLETLAAEQEERLETAHLTEQHQSQLLVDRDKQLGAISLRNESLGLEVERLRAEAAQSIEQIAALSERAARAETRLEQFDCKTSSTAIGR